MIHSTKDVQDAFEVLVRERNPSLAKLMLSEGDLVKFYEQFLKPVYNWAERPLVVGFITYYDEPFDPNKHQPDALAQANGGRYPDYCWPGGLLIVYQVSNEEHNWVCSRCAQRMREDPKFHPDDSITGWQVLTSGDRWWCNLCSSYWNGQLDPIL